MNPSQPTGYGPALAALLREPGLTALTVGRPREVSPAKLRLPAGNEVFAPHTVHDRDQAAACRAGLWLYLDSFEQSHGISQDLHTAEGNYWHAILHRREPDADNARYWFRRVGAHPVFEPLRLAAVAVAEKAPAAAASLRRQPRWDPFAFVDLCEAAHGGQVDCLELCLAIQRREWELLFDYCFRRAIGLE